MKKHAIAILAVLVAVATGILVPAAGGSPAAAAHRKKAPDAVLAWNQIANDVMVTTGITPLFDPLHESRIYAMVHIAIHDALNGIERHSSPYAIDLSLVPTASPDAAVATAAHDVLMSTLPELPPGFLANVPAALTQVDKAYTAALAAVPNGNSENQGVKLGHDAATAIITKRAPDGADTLFIDESDLKEPLLPGDFRFVDETHFRAAPGWGEVTPFVMSSGDQFRPPPPHALASAEYAADFNELKELGSLTSTSRTRQQTEIAFFWFEASPMRWNRIARTVSSKADLGMWDNARLFALLNVVEADGYIGNWDSKYAYNRWRPSTAVHLADNDENPLTEPDKGWTPLWGSSGATPEYDSGHTIEGAGAAAVLAGVLGSDHATFRVCSYTFMPPQEMKHFSPANNCNGRKPIYRTYHSFSQAAQENGVSRIYIGWHFRNAVQMGYVHGTRIGDLALSTLFMPIP